MIDVKRTASDDPTEFEVTVTEGSTRTHHRVTMADTTYRKLSKGAASPERVVEAAVAFLLEREPKESILTRFDIPVISRYFPSFEKEVGRYL
jgi:hypothetical protein